MRKNNPSKALEFRVSESELRDINKGIVRIDPRHMKDLGLQTKGDFVFIKGERDTIAIAAPNHDPEKDIRIIQMDGSTRRNAKTGIGEVVKVKKTNVKEAKRVIIAPLEEGVVADIPGILIKGSLIGRPVIEGDIIIPGGTDLRKNIISDSPIMELLGAFEGEMLGGMFFGFNEIRFLVIKTDAKGPVLITQNTEIIVRPQAQAASQHRVAKVSYEDIGGLEEEIKKIREMVELPLKHPEVFERMGIDPPKGILLYGPPGTGKTLLAKAVASETDAYFYVINGPEILSKYYGESEKHLRDIFDQAEKNSPSIIFIDEIDAIAPKRDEMGGEVERGMVAQLNSLMDGLKSRGKVIVIAATNMPNMIDPALRRPGRFDRELEIRAPNFEARKRILQIHMRNVPMNEDINLDEIAQLTYGYVGADLAAVARESVMIVIRRLLPELLKTEKVLPKEVLAKLSVSMSDVLESLKFVGPSALREVFIEKPNVTFADIGNLENIKQDLMEAIEWPIRYPGLYREVGIRQPKGILLYGPPGTGKTLLAKAVAAESKANFILVNGPELLSKWVGESEKGVRKTFERAKQVSPSIIFFDEIDALAPRRGFGDDSGATERVVNQLLAEISGLKDLQGVVILAATNRPDLIDSALLRPGRFDKVVNVPIPNENSRLWIFKIHTKNMKLEKDVDLRKLAKETEGYVGADIEAVCMQAGLKMLEENIKDRKIFMKHFEGALKEIGPSVTPEIAQVYKRFEKQFRRKLGDEMAKEAAYLG